MGRSDGIEAVLRDIVRPRAAYVAVLPESVAAVETPVPARSGSPDGPDVGRSGAVPAVPGRRPAAPADRHRRAEPALPARVRLVAAVVGHRRRGLLRDPRRRPPRRRGRDPRDQPAGPPRGRRQRPDPRRLSWTRLRDRRDRRRDRGAAPDLRPGRPQRPLRQPARPPGVPAPGLRRARPLRGASRPSARLALAELRPGRCDASSPARRTTLDDRHPDRARDRACPPTT